MISTTTLALLPALNKCGSLKLRKGEVLVTAAGFEDRALAASHSLVAGRSNRALVLKYENGDSRNKLGEVLKTLREKRLDVDAKDIVSYDRYDPDSFPGGFERKLVELEAKRVVVDISAMS